MLHFANKMALTPYLHTKALDYVDKILADYQVLVKVSKARESKFGDYRFPFKKDFHQITVNGNLNSYAFLITLIHEIAHLIAFDKHGRKITPHGSAWKQCFQHAMKPLLNETFFNENVLAALKKYMQNPKASSASDLALFGALKAFDSKSEHSKQLDTLACNAHFKLKNRIFKKLEKRRTRILCEEVPGGKKYLIHSQAEVEILDTQKQL